MAMVVLFGLSVLAAPPARASGSPVEAVQGLVQAGELELARDQLLAWQPQSAAEAERRLWLLAVVYREGGRPDLALIVLEDLVARRPDVARFRLELADTLARLGQQDRAAYHYDLARGGELSDAQRAHAASNATRMETPSPWTGNFGIALVPSSNPGRKTQEETLDLGFGTAVLSQESRAQPATGLEVGARLAYAHRISQRLQGQVAVNLNGRLFADRDDNDVTGSIEAGLVHRLGPDALLRTTLSYQRRDLGGDLYSRGPGFGVNLMLRSGARGRIGLGLTLSDLTYPGAPGADGLRSVAMLSYDHALSPTFGLRTLLRYERVDAVNADVAATSWEAGLGASQVFRGGLILDADLRLRRSGRDGPHGLFGVVQQDRRQTLSLRLRHSEVSWRGFAPYVELTAERQRSSIPYYSYDAQDLTLGLTRRF